MVFYYQRLRDGEIKMMRTIDNINLDDVTFRFDCIMKESRELLINIKMCSKEDSIIVRLQKLNKLDDDAMALIAFAETFVERFPWRAGRIERMKIKYDKIFVAERDKVIFNY